jgi:hypothetical protein
MTKYISFHNLLRQKGKEYAKAAYLAYMTDNAVVAKDGNFVRAHVRWRKGLPVVTLKEDGDDTVWQVVGGFFDPDTI